MKERWPVRLPLLAANTFIYLFLFAPILVVIAMSFNGAPRFAFPMQGVSLRWYRELISNWEVLDAIRTSLIIAVPATLLAVGTGVPAALVIDRCIFPGRTAVLTFLMSPLIIPHVVLGMAILLLYARLGAEANVVGFVLGHALIAAPFVTRTVLAGLARLDYVLEETAMSLGAADWQVKLHVTLPLLKPSIYAGAFFAFMSSFDNVPLSVFIAAPHLTPLPVKIYAQLDAHGVDLVYAAVGAAMIVATVTLLLFLDRRVGVDYLGGGYGAT